MFSLSKKLSPTITDMIRFDHSHVLVTFHQYTADKNPKVRKALADTICNALEIHATLEEEIFYPAMEMLDAQNDVLQKSVPEHQEMRELIAELRATSASSSRHNEIVMQLMRDVIHHVADEETVLLPKAELTYNKDRLSELGVQMTKRRLELVAPKAGKIAMDTAIGFSGSTMAWIAGSAAVMLALKRLAKPRAEIR
ncbi:MAG: hemerythrin domain-containing protein [Herminiimonas sp.]|uniref:hemerythrin domain-containing protein n=1 Tax=Herminiimonas sp. TaxID=1926289 RepID=UPI002718391E|nr:hemerythrin domain-containing protein [Herminiimonas sp.]MDO9419232.1 hemerythrin domain-containing protein [Herminiimonas sp.]